MRKESVDSNPLTSSGEHDVELRWTNQVEGKV